MNRLRRIIRCVFGLSMTWWVPTVLVIGGVVVLALLTGNSEAVRYE